MACLDADVAMRFQEVRQEARRHADVAQRTLNRLAEQFGREGIPFFVIKGSVLAEHVYGDPSLRRFADVDLVTRRELLGRAETVLRSLGYRLGQVEQLLATPPHGPAESQAAEALTRRFYESSQYELPFDVPRSVGLLPVDLHWHVAPAFRLNATADQLWEQTVAVVVAGTRVTTFNPAATLIHLAVHASTCALAAFRMLHFCDVAWAATRWSDEADRLWALAEAWGVATHLDVVLDTVERGLGVAHSPYAATRGRAARFIPARAPPGCDRNLPTGGRARVGPYKAAAHVGGSRVERRHGLPPLECHAQRAHAFRAVAVERAALALQEARSIVSESAHAEPVSRYREIRAQRRDEALSLGYPLRHFFPHRFYYLPKCGPDGFKLAQRMCGTSDPSACWEIVLYASSPTIDEFPAHLFFDDDLVWHQQQFGRVGQIATANLVVDGTDLYTMVHVSDLVQRIARRREHKTRIENRFKGWHHMLLNAVGNFALEHGLSRIYAPTAAFAMLHTDRKRTVQPDLFERIYDRDIHSRFPGATRAGSWWVIDVKDIGARILVAEAGTEPVADEKTICICHDIERGLGHIGIDPDFVPIADRTSPASLDAMLAAEHDANVRTTYNVVGVLLNEVRPRLEADGHCIAFHSYDHQIDDLGEGHTSQLQKCRSVDYRIKGYRVPRSRMTAELTDANLCMCNFEWLASSAKSLGTLRPAMQNRIVRMPILFDDFPLFQGRMSYADWERAALERIDNNHFVAFGLHDCYAPHWLPHYRDFLRRVSELGTLRTVDAVAFDVIMGAAC